MKKIPLIILTVASVFVSCVDKDMFNNIHVKPNTTLPIGTAVIADTTLFRLAGLQDEISKDAQSVLFFMVQGENKLINRDNISRIFAFQPQNLTFNVPISGLSAPGQPVDVNGIAVAANVNLKLGQRVDVLRVQSAVVSLTMSTPGDYSNFACTIPEITQNGQPITIKPNEPITIDQSYIIKPKYSDAYKNNYLSIYFKGTVPDTPYLSGAISITGSSPAYVEGFLGNESISKSSSAIQPADDNFFEFTSQAKSAYFANPSIDIRLNSTVNMPVMIQIKEVLIDGSKVNLKEEFESDRFLVKADETTPSFRIDNTSTITGTGFSDAITKDFKKITISVNAVINPNPQQLMYSQYEPNTYNSFTDNDVIELYYDVNLPFDCNLQGVKFIQEIQLNLTDLAQNPNQKYEELAMMIGGYNELPMNLEINPFVAQGNNPNSKRTYLFDKSFVISGADDNLQPWNPKFQPYEMEKPLKFIINQSKIDDMLVSSKLFLDITASTAPANTNPGTARPATRKFYSPCELGLDIVIGAKADINITPSNK